MGHQKQEHEFKKHSELSHEEQKAVRSAQVTQDNYQRAFQALSDACGAAGMCLPEHSDVEMAAKILQALPKDRIPRADGGEGIHGVWLITESYMMQGRNLAAINFGLLVAMRGPMFPSDGSGAKERTW